MKDRSSYDILLDYPKSKGLDSDSDNSNTKFYLAPNEQFLNTKYVLFKAGSVFFIAYDTYSAKLSMSKTFSGVYKVFPYNHDIDISFLKRDILDKLSFRKRALTGNQFIDKRITIKSKQSYAVKGFFKKEDADRFLQLNDRIPPIEILIKSNYLNMIKDFKGKNVIGIETNEWIYNHDDIDYLIDQGGQLINDIINRTIH